MVRRRTRSSARAQLLERARKSPVEFFAPLAPRQASTWLTFAAVQVTSWRLPAPFVSPGKAVGVDLSETMIKEATQRSHGRRFRCFLPCS